MATLPKVLISRADYQIGGGVALRLRTQARRSGMRVEKKLHVPLEKVRKVLKIAKESL
jgi:hypothetical protein